MQLKSVIKCPECGFEREETMPTEHSPDKTQTVGRVILRWPEVHRRRKKSRTQTWRDVRAGTFPAPVQIGPNSVGWYEDEVEANLASLPRVDYAPDDA